MAEKSNTIWFWIGGGCLVLLVLFSVAAATIGYLGYNEVQRVRSEMSNPEMRTDRAAELLGTEELPEGYESTIAFSVSRFFKTVILTNDNETDEGGGAILLYLQTPGKQKPKVMAYMRGETDNPRVLSEQGVNIRLDDPADHGEFESRAGRILWVTHYGDLNVDPGDFAGLEEALERAEQEERAKDGSSSGAEDQSNDEEDSSSRDRSFARHGEGTTTIFTPLCDDRRSRLGIWSGPHEIPGRPELQREPPMPSELVGSTGDPARIEAFLRDMDLCR